MGFSAWVPFLQPSLSHFATLGKLTYLQSLCLLVCKIISWSSCRGSAVMNPTSICEDTSSIPGLAQCWLRIRHCAELGGCQRYILDLASLWLWCRPTAVALIRLLAWELPYDVGVTLKRKKEKERKFGERVKIKK